MLYTEEKELITLAYTDKIEVKTMMEKSQYAQYLNETHSHKVVL